MMRRLLKVAISPYLLLSVLTAALVVEGVCFIGLKDDSPAPKRPPQPATVDKDRAPVNQLDRHSSDPIIVEVLTPFPGASAEEVERQVTLPLETVLTGMPRLECVCSKSLFGGSIVCARFENGTDQLKAREQVIERLTAPARPLPAGAIPQIDPVSGEAIFRYTLAGPKDRAGRDIYSLGDLLALQHEVLQRELLRLPGVADVSSFGGPVDGFVIHPDPDRLRRYGVTLQQMEDALTRAGLNQRGDLRPQGGVAARAHGFLGDRNQPVHRALALKDAPAAAAFLRSEERRRLREIRALLIAAVKNQPIRVEDLVEGGRVAAGNELAGKGVLIGQQTRPGRVGVSRRDARGHWHDEDARVQGEVWLRHGDPSPIRRMAPSTVRRGVKELIQQLQDTPGQLLPGVRIEPFDEHPPDSAGVLDNLWIHGALPFNISFERAAEIGRSARSLLREHAEIEMIVSQVGMPAPDFEQSRFDTIRLLARLRPAKSWPVPASRKRPHTRAELIAEIEAELDLKIPGVSWTFTGGARDNTREPFQPAPGDALVRIFGPDLEQLEQLAGQTREVLESISGVHRPQVLHSLGRTNIEMRVDAAKCARWGVSVADANAVIQAATRERRILVGNGTISIGRSQRRDPTAILDTPVDIVNSSVLLPNAKGVLAAQPLLSAQPRLRLRDLVSPVGKDGKPDPNGEFVRVGAAVIYREQGQRLLAVRFQIRGPDQAAILAEARKKTGHLISTPYRAEWVVR
jgi:hypothetical protein